MIVMAKESVVDMTVYSHTGVSKKPWSSKPQQSGLDKINTTSVRMKNDMNAHVWIFPCHFHVDLCCL